MTSTLISYRMLRFFGLVAMTGLMQGCAMLGSMTNVVVSSTANLFSGAPSPSFLDWKAITVIAAPDANQNSPLALDLVFVRDSTTLEKLLTLPASRWFSSKQELQNTYPNAIVIRSWELVPQQILQLSEDDLGSPRVAGMLVYADYLGPGDHRIQLPLTKESFLVELGARSFTVQKRPR
jgi:type VI secretion system protein